MKNKILKILRYSCLLFVIVFGLMAIIGINGGCGGDGDNGVSNTDPTATITSPSDGSTYNEGDTITFSGTGSDAEDGILTGSSLVWTSSIDGQIGTGESFTKNELSAGTHTITLTATDSESAIGSDTVSITVFAPVKIGEIHPFTGLLAEFGEPGHNAALLAVKHLEEAGYTVETVSADSETDAVAGVEAAQTLVEDEDVQVLVGAASSGVTISIAESVSIPSQIPQISYASSSPLISELPADEGQDFLFRTCPSDALQGVVLAQMAYDTGYMKAAVLYINNPYGQGLNEVFKENFEALGGTVCSVPIDEVPAVSYATELQQAIDCNPDVLIAISYPSHATVYLAEAIDGGFISTFLFVDGTKSEKIIDAVGADALEGMRGTAPGLKETDSLEIFNSTYEAEYGQAPPVSFMTNSYDAVILAALAAYEAQVAGEELTSTAIRDHLRIVSGPLGEKALAGSEGLTQALKLLREGSGIDYVGASGDVDFDENGDVISPIEIWSYEGGEIVSKGLVQP